MQFRTLTVRTVAAALVAWNSGCVVLVPADEVISGQEISEKRTLFLEPGKTSKDDVINRLGDPSVIWDSERIFVYRWEQLFSYAYWFVAYRYSGQAGVLPLSHDHALIIQFDENDRVRRFGRTKRAPMRSFGHMLREWMDAK